MCKQYYTKSKQKGKSSKSMQKRKSTKTDGWKEKKGKSWIEQKEKERFEAWRKEEIHCARGKHWFCGCLKTQHLGFNFQPYRTGIIAMFLYAAASENMDSFLAELSCTCSYMYQLQLKKACILHHPLASCSAIYM